MCYFPIYFMIGAMTDSMVIELLILSLLLAVNARLFFVARGQRDAVVLLSPVAFVVSALVFFAWGITLLNGAIFILALVVLLENGLGIWRFCNKLYVDSFSPLLWLCSVANILLILALGASVVIFRPVPVPPTVQVAERTLALTGSHHSGLRLREGVFAPVDVLLQQFKPKSDTGPWTEPGKSIADGTETAATDLPLVLWITDRRTTADRVRPVAAELAALGYEVVVADFNQDIPGSFASRLKAIFSPQEFQKEVDTWVRESSFQYGALIECLGGKGAMEDRVVFFLGDGYTGDGMEAALLLHDFVAGGHAIGGSAEETGVLSYWPDGFGPVGETAPWLNYLVCGTGLMESRDFSRSHSIAAAQQSHGAFEEILFADKESSVEPSLEGEPFPEGDSFSQEGTAVAGATRPPPVL